MTAVFQVNSNSTLQGFQVGTSDLFAAASIAHSAYGWLGALRGVTSIFGLIKNTEQERKPHELLPKALTTPLCARILTAQGIAFIPNRLDDLEYAFGGDSASRMIGLSLCALSHELGLITGLEWVGKNIHTPYYTKSAAVVRVAACLQEVEYTISSVSIWNGNGKKTRMRRSVTLILSGSHETDPMMEEMPYHFPLYIFASHYHFSTVGSMLLNTLSGPCPRLSPEAAQSLFEIIFENFQSRLQFNWQSNTETQINAVPIWKSGSASQSQSKHSSRRLASLAFPQSKAQVSHYFNELTDEPTKQEILDSFNKLPQHFQNRQLPLSLVRYRFFTASIMLAVVAIIAGPEFVQVRYCTRFTLLVRSHDVIEQTNALLNKGLSYSRVASLISFFHCGLYHSSLTEEDTPPSYSSGYYDHMPKAQEQRLVGWRDGNYVVLPRLLFALSKPINRENTFGFICCDNFISNIPVHADGSIMSSGHGSLDPDYRSTKFFDIHSSSAGSSSSITDPGSQPSIGEPSPDSPDILLYISIERGLDTGLPIPVLCGRVRGELLGEIDVYSILLMVTNSLRHDHRKDGSARSMIPLASINLSRRLCSTYLSPNGSPRTK